MKGHVRGEELELEVRDAQGEGVGQRGQQRVRHGEGALEAVVGGRHADGAGGRQEVVIL